MNYAAPHLTECLIRIGAGTDQPTCCGCAGRSTASRRTATRATDIRIPIPGGLPSEERRDVTVG
jgi:hypothetical protein